jgi:hypothetical protein
MWASSRSIGEKERPLQLLPLLDGRFSRVSMGAVVGREERELRPGSDPELAQDRGELRAHVHHRYPEARGNLVVREALRDQSSDACLA